MLDDGIGYGDDVGGDGVGGDGERGGLVAFEGDGFVLGQIEKGYLGVSAGQQHVVVELVDVDDVGVLVGVEFGQQLIIFLRGCVLVLEENTVGIPTVNKLVECLDLVESGQLTTPKRLRVHQFGRNR